MVVAQFVVDQLQKKPDHGIMKQSLTGSGGGLRRRGRRETSEALMERVRPARL
jgi:1-deoxy-D-xylulose 5-phosphate reductoisomerase